MLPRMSNEQSSDGAGAGGTGDAVGPDRAATRERRGPPPNPLYHPLFLPVLLVGFTLWFFWDGFVTSDPAMLEHQMFNRICFTITALICLRVVPRGIREFREEKLREELARQEPSDAKPE